jgi:hypothetical protein
MLLNALLIGAIAIAAWVVALVFFRFYRQTGDRFFALFGWAFVLEGAHRIPDAFGPLDADAAAAVYALRLVAYLLILYAIWRKNRSRGA